MSVYRFTVRGRFVDLDDRQRARLTAALAEHDIFVSAYTPEGTFTYDHKLDFFNLRYEIRIDDGTSTVDAATERGRSEAEMFLRTLGYGHSALRVNAVDMATMWNASDGGGSSGRGSDLDA